jgi:hypothetical protein
MAPSPGGASGTSGGSHTRTWLEGAGIGILLTLGLTWNQLSPTHLDLYHKLLPVTTVVRAIALGQVAACLVGIALIVLLDRLDHAGRTLLWTLLFAGLAARTLSGLMVAQIVDRRGVTPLLAFGAAAAVLLLLWIVRRRWYTATIRGLRVAILLLGFCIIWVLPTLAVAGLAKQPWDQASFQKAMPHGAGPHRRIVWILFDEMSFDQTFAHRWPGLEMPNFDRLREHSIMFSDVQPDGYYTEEVIPSLLLGKPIVAARSTSAGELLYQSGKGGGWAKFDGKASLFADAQRAGWTTGISGDYNPYCRILRGQLDWCRMELIVFGDHLDREKSTWGNFTAPIHAAWARLTHERYEPGSTEAAKFAGMVDSAKRLIADDEVDFAFVHLYLPHPPGVYDRRTGQVKFGGSYIDNLALADRVLGELVATLDQTRSAGETTLVISSDHSWRVGIWRNGMAWTHEDEVASGHGKFDPRPVLMVRLPGQTAGAQIAQPVPLLSMHDMLEQMISGRIDSLEDLKAWEAQR